MTSLQEAERTVEEDEKRFRFKPYLYTNLYSDIAFLALKMIFDGLFFDHQIQRDDDGMVTLNNDFGATKNVSQEMKSKQIASVVNNIILKKFKVPGKVHDHVKDTTLVEVGCPVQVRHLIFLRDWLYRLEEKTLKRRYGEDLYNEMVGSPKDPFEISKAKILREEEEKILAKHLKLVDKIRSAWFHAHHEEEREELGIELDKIDESYQREIEELEKSLF